MKCLTKQAASAHRVFSIDDWAEAATRLEAPGRNVSRHTDRLPLPNNTLQHATMDSTQRRDAK
jgi:hypothetical protein